ncbi:MAG: hypothetical protein AB7L91_10945 [Dehalococcoidia bacterium]
MTTEEPITTYCETHPDVESELRCGRCEKLICPRCLVYTPGGVRCRDCAQLRRPVMYELSTTHYLRAAGAAVGVGVVVGIIGGLLLPPTARVPLFGLFLALFAGSGIGSLMAEAITRATRGKRGTSVQSIALGGVVVGAAVRLAVSGQFDLVAQDLIGLFAFGIAAAVAWGRLR